MVIIIIIIIITAVPDQDQAFCFRPRLREK